MNVSERYRSIQDIVYSTLQSDIALGEYQIGEKLGIRELSRQMNVSAAPIREALMCLVTDGLVTFKPRIGFFVSSHEPNEISDIFDIRLALERLACDKAVINRTEHELVEVETVLHKLKTTNADDWHTVNREFHLAIYRCAHSSRLYQEIIRQWDLISVYLRLYVRWFTLPIKAQEQHVQMYDALRDQDAEKLSALIEPHLNITRDRILQKIRTKVK